MSIVHEYTMAAGLLVQVSSLLMQKLGLEIPQFRLRRSLVIRTTRKSDGHLEVSVL